MGNETLSRRKFFGKLRTASNNQNGDPLFDKYSRKTSGRLNGNGETTAFQKGAEPDPVAGTALRVVPVLSGLNQYTGTWTEREALHLLRRTTYGAKRADVTTLTGMTMSAAVDSILNTGTPNPTPPVNWYNLLLADPSGVAYGANWTNTAFPAYSQDNQTCNYYRQESIRTWLWAQGLNQPATIFEKMTMFWYHFIPVDFETVTNSSNNGVDTNSARILYKYMQMFRTFAVGNFRSLITQMSTQPSMMFYLNNQANTATAPDENFARELMELFTLGKDPSSQYTETDVVAAARVLTGWRVQNMYNTSTATNFVANQHATGNKQFSAFFNNTVIAGTGAQELTDFLNLLFSKQQVVSQYICRRLYRFFVYYDIDANIEANVIVPLAQHFVANNWEIKPVLEKLLKSEHFFDLANRGVFIKTPADLIAGTFRSFNISTDVSDPSNHQAQHQLRAYVNNNIAKPMEQHMGYVPNVSGWNAFYQPPAFHQYWINTNTVQKRFAFISQLFTTNGYNLTYNTLNTKLRIDSLAFVQQFPNSIAGEPNLLVDACIKYLLPVEISQAKRDEIKLQTLLYQQVTDQYWATAWTNYINNPTNTGFRNIVTDRSKSLLYTIMQLAEYQLM